MADPTTTRRSGQSGDDLRPTGAGPGRSTSDMHGGEQAANIDGRELDVALPGHLRALATRLTAAFEMLEASGFRDELTLLAPAERIVELLTFCRDEPDIRCELLADLSGVHWPAGKRTESAQETTGWPSYEFGDEAGRIEVDYVLYSLTHGHRFRIRVELPDVDPMMPTVTGVYGAANFMEREVYDFFGVQFQGHPNLVRILMPDAWEGFPLRKDYPLGGGDVQYKGATIPPPDQRHY
ncbi:MAG: NADH-quinone oxidoreductase subunit C [Actinomycetota bacterium]|nr:NADH-quinone oxidoreductase subunit C [Actinomycetota bacterium]